MTSHCVGTVQMREESEIKWEEMWFKTTAEDGERRGQQWRVMEDCSTDERLQQETLCLALSAMNHNHLSSRHWQQWHTRWNKWSQWLQSIRAHFQHISYFIQQAELLITEIADWTVSEILVTDSLRDQGQCRGWKLSNCVPMMALPIDFLRHFCRGMYRLATIHSVTDRRTTLSCQQPNVVRSAKTGRFKNPII